MSTAVAAAPLAPLPPMDRQPSPRSYPALAPSSATLQTFDRMEMNRPDSAPQFTAAERSPSDGRKSPRSARPSLSNKITVKKEPGSPTSQNSRHRPRKLDLNTSTSVTNNVNNGRTSTGTPITGRDTLAMHDVGLACLSPGFQTHDPAMREQINRSISVRDQQRSIIEARLLRSAKGDGPEKPLEIGKPSTPTLNSSTKKRPPPGLSIVPPPAHTFANERMIQSAPLNQNFTGRNQPMPAARPNERPAPGYPQSSHIQHVPAVQTSNRLPPILDVFGADALSSMSSRPPFQHSNSTPSQNGPPMPSPGFPPQTAHPSFPQSDRPREYRSAEEAVHELTGGREDLRPKIVRYGRHQPPTPPSPRTDTLTPQKHHNGPFNTTTTSGRRTRQEYEEGSSPPLGTGRTGGPQTGPFGEGRDSPATIKAKKEEFLSLCSRAWDLFHS